MSANDDQRREAWAAELEAAADEAAADGLMISAMSLADHAGAYRQEVASDQIDNALNRISAAKAEGIAQLKRFVQRDDVELVGDVGFHITTRRNEAWEHHLKLLRSGPSDRLGMDGRVVAVGPGGVIADRDAFAPDAPETGAIRVLEPKRPEFVYPITAEFPVKAILKKHISITDIFGHPEQCEFSVAVSGNVGGGACISCADPNAKCCDTRADGWAVDYWKQKNYLLAWRACRPCLNVVAYNREHPCVNGGGEWVSAEHAEHINNIYIPERRAREHAQGERLRAQWLRDSTIDHEAIRQHDQGWLRQQREDDGNADDDYDPYDEDDYEGD